MPFYQLLGGPDFIITSVLADDRGGVMIRMAGGYSLQIVTETNDDERDPDAGPEQWRFLPVDRSQHHFVIGTDGVERY